MLRLNTPNLPNHCHTFDHKSSPAFNLGAGSCLGGTAGIDAGTGLGSAGADPQSPKSSSAAIFGGGGAAEPKPPNPLSAAGGDCTEPHPPDSVEAALLESPAEEAQSGWAFDVLLAGAVGDLPQPLWVLAGAAFVGKEGVPHPKSAPLTEVAEGLATERPVCGVAIAGSFVFHSFAPQGSVARLVNVVLDAGAED